MGTLQMLQIDLLQFHLSSLDSSSLSAHWTLNVDLLCMAYPLVGIFPFSFVVIIPFKPRNRLPWSNRVKYSLKIQAVGSFYLVPLAGRLLGIVGSTRPLVVMLVLQINEREIGGNNQLSSLTSQYRTLNKGFRTCYHITR